MTVLELALCGLLFLLVFAGCCWAAYSGGYADCKTRMEPSKNYWKTEAKSMLLENRELEENLQRLKLALKKLEG